MKYQTLNNKKVLIGISGGIAAYKIPLLIRFFIKAGASVKVVITDSGLQFVTKCTLETLSKNKVYSDMFEPYNDTTTEHISLTDWADILVIAPATANIIGKYANGIADDVLSTTLMAFNRTVIIAPAMNSKMYDNFSFKKNVNFLKENGVFFIEPDTGELACGYNGKGRMSEPEHIFREVEFLLNRSTPNKYFGKKVVVTASRTEEALDPVRYLSNHSSGKTGFLLAEEFAKRGAIVTLITGPSTQIACDAVKRINVLSANEMYKKVVENFKNADILVMSAAVADYSFETSKNKLKKQSGSIFSNAIRTKDILKTIGTLKKQSQILVGFALETENMYENAQKKLQDKNLDLIVLNSITDKNSAFQSDKNEVTIITNNNNKIQIPSTEKILIAQKIVDKIAEIL